MDLKKNICGLGFACLLAGTLQAGEIALSFDDAPLGGSSLISGIEKTERIIEGLKSRNVAGAVFFVTTGNINGEEGVNRLTKYTKAGYHLAHHSHTHLSAAKVTPLEYIADFNRAHAELKGYDNVLKLHRFPYLQYGQTQSVRTQLLQHLREQGYRIGYVTVDNFDWYINHQLQLAHSKGQKIDYNKLRSFYLETIWQAIEFYDEIAKKHLSTPVKHVLLLHENELAALFIGDLVAYIREKGWKIISPVEAYQDKTLQAYTPAFDYNGQGRVAAIAKHQGASPKMLRHANESTDVIAEKLKDLAIFTDPVN